MLMSIFYMLILAAAILILLPFGSVQYGAFSQQSPENNDELFPEIPDFGSGSEPDLSSLFPQLNTSDLNLTADSEPRSGITAVSGTYSNDKIGFQINLPSGWTGEQLKFLVNMAIVSPEGYQIAEPAKPDTIITVSGIDAIAFQALADLAQKIAESGAIQDLSQLDLTGVSSGHGAISCIKISSSPTTINGIPAEEIEQDCNDEGVKAKGKGYVIGTEDNSFIALGFYSSSVGKYDQYLPVFEESVKSIKISKPGDITKSDAFNKFKEFETKLRQNITSG
jgi:hypothetical protein